MKFIILFLTVLFMVFPVHAKKIRSNDLIIGDSTGTEKRFLLGRGGQNIIKVPGGGGDIEFSNDGGFTFKTIGSGGGSTGSLNSVQVADGSNNFIGDSDFIWDPDLNEMTVLGKINISGVLGSDSNTDNFYDPDTGGVGIIASSSSLVFSIDHDNNQVDRFFQWLKNNSQEIMSLNEDGDLDLPIGSVTSSGFLTDGRFSDEDKISTNFYEPDSGGTGNTKMRAASSIALVVDEDADDSSSVFEVSKDGGVTFMLRSHQDGRFDINGGPYQINGVDIAANKWRTLGSNAPIHCAFTITNSAGTPVLTSNDSCVTSLVDHGVGQWTLNLSGFTTITGCDVSAVTSNADAGCHVHSFSSSAVRTFCLNPSGATPSDITVSGSCSGT